MQYPTAPIWTPTATRASNTALHSFATANASCQDFASLHNWSIRCPEEFWSAVWDFASVRGVRGDRTLVPGNPWWTARFFPDGQLNYAENLLRRTDDAPAIMFRREDGVEASLSWHDLYVRVSCAQQALRDAGVAIGDRVAAWLPNIPETYIVMLATASLGAVFTSSSPDFGVESIIDRFGQIEPVVLFAADGYIYGGRKHDCLERLRLIRSRLPSVREVVVVEQLEHEPHIEPIPNAVRWSDWLARNEPTTVRYEQLPFDHPLAILYSSGTTGLPKCIVHRAGGVLIKHLVEHQLHCDIRRGDRVFYFTTTGWMMWNWLASALASEATVVLYDGNPTFPEPDVLWQVAADYRVTMFGTSAKYLDGCRKLGLRPAENRDLSAVRMISSTGSPLTADTFAYVYRDVLPDVYLASMSGGTDLVGALVGGDPNGDVWAGEIQAPSLGLGIEVFDDAGQPVGLGVPGELVCTTPFPSMPLGFWNDPDGARYRAAYFDRFAGAWHQGDFASRTEHGGFIIHGRSDATLNPGGIRIGTSEIYRQLENITEVLESVVVGQKWGADVRVVLLVVLRSGFELTDELVRRIRRQVREGTTPRHVPAIVLAVPDIPKTRNGKITEIAVRNAVNGQPAGNTDALVNPEALEIIRMLDGLRA